MGNFYSHCKDLLKLILRNKLDSCQASASVDSLPYLCVFTRVNTLRLLRECPPCVWWGEKKSWRTWETVRLWVEAADPFVPDQSWNQSQFQKQTKSILKDCVADWSTLFPVRVVMVIVVLLASSIRVCLQVVLNKKHFHTWEKKTSGASYWSSHHVEKSPGFIGFKFGHNRL